MLENSKMIYKFIKFCQDTVEFLNYLRIYIVSAIQMSHKINRKNLMKFTQSANQHMHTFNFLFIKTYLKFLKTLLHVSVIRPSSGGL